MGRLACWRAWAKFPGVPAGHDGCRIRYLMWLREREQEAASIHCLRFAAAASNRCAAVFANTFTFP
jgi:hypothetical protein